MSDKAERFMIDILGATGISEYVYRQYVDAGRVEDAYAVARRNALMLDFDKIYILLDPSREFSTDELQEIRDDQFNIRGIYSERIIIPPLYDLPYIPPGMNTLPEELVTMILLGLDMNSMISYYNSTLMHRKLMNSQTFINAARDKFKVFRPASNFRELQKEYLKVSSTPCMSKDIRECMDRAFANRDIEAVKRIDSEMTSGHYIFWYLYVVEVFFDDDIQFGLQAMDAYNNSHTIGDNQEEIEYAYYGARLRAGQDVSDVEDTIPEYIKEIYAAQMALINGNDQVFNAKIDEIKRSMQRVSVRHAIRRIGIQMVALVKTVLEIGTLEQIKTVFDTNGEHVMFKPEYIPSTRTDIPEIVELYFDAMHGPLRTAGQLNEYLAEAIKVRAVGVINYIASTYGHKFEDPRFIYDAIDSGLLSIVRTVVQDLNVKIRQDHIIDAARVGYDDILLYLAKAYRSSM